jgi:hypothetical protein
MRDEMFVPRLWEAVAMTLSNIRRIRDEVGPLPPSSILLATPTKARDIARSLKSLANEYAEIGMHHEAYCMMRGSGWWLAYAITLVRAKDTKE